MKTIRIFWITLTCLFGLCATLPASAQKRKEKEARMEREVKEAIQARHYKISVNYMFPQRGNGRMVTSDYSIEVRNDSLFSYLPYFGVAHRAPYGGSKGLVFNAPITHYETEVHKKGKIQIKFDVRNEEDSYTYYITLYTNGSANIDVRPTNKDSISFSGELETEEPSEDSSPLCNQTWQHFELAATSYSQ